MRAASASVTIGRCRPPRDRATEPVIHVRGLVKRYGDLVAVDGIDFEVARAARSSGCSGPNGAGKTTTVEILEGLRTPGRRRGDGPRRRRRRPDADALKPRIGVSLQTAALYPKLTVTELIDLFRSFYPTSRPTDELIDLLELGERRNARTQELSGGQRQRLARRPGARQRPGAGLPRRADDRPRPGRPAVAVGPRPRPQGARAGRSC